MASLLGKYDNLHEPQPNINKRSTILAAVITFLVRRPHLSRSSASRCVWPETCPNWQNSVLGPV